MSDTWGQPPVFAGSVFSIVQFEPKSAEAFEELGTYYKPLKAYTLKEENECLMYKTAKNKTKIVVMQEWKNMNAFKRYTTSDEFKVLKEAMERLCTGSPVVNIYEDLPDPE